MDRQLAFLALLSVRLDLIRYSHRGAHPVRLTRELIDLLLLGPDYSCFRGCS